MLTALQEQKDKHTDAKVEEMREKLARANSDSQMMASLMMVGQKMIGDARKSWEGGHTWVHVDMDQFFAAVEERENPALKGKPVAVGGMSMISTANYVARKFGVRAAMPGFIAVKLCPDLIFVHSSFGKYAEVSKEVEAVILEFDENATMVSVDEGRLEITDFLAR